MRALAVLALAGWLVLAPREEERATTWIFIRAASEDPGLSPEAAQAATEGHFANMTRMTEAGHLLVAGPLGSPRSDPAHRGIFVIDEPGPAQGLAIAQSDPAFQAGVFELEALPFVSGDPLRRIPELDRADWTARSAASPTGETPWEGRAYVLASARDGAAAGLALEPLVEEGAVLFRGRLADGFLACLDVTDSMEAGEMLAAMNELAGEDVVWTLHGWYGSRGLVQLPFLRAHPEAPTFDLRPVSEGTWAKEVDVFGVSVRVHPGVTDRVALCAAHLVAQYLDPDEDGEPVAAAKRAAGALELASSGDEQDVDALVRSWLAARGVELPGAQPDGTYRH